MNDWEIVVVVSAFGLGFLSARILKQFARANRTLEAIYGELRVVIENQDEDRHERQMQEEAQHDRENDSQGR